MRAYIVFSAIISDTFAKVEFSFGKIMGISTLCGLISPTVENSSVGRIDFSRLSIEVLLHYLRLHRNFGTVFWGVFGDIVQKIYEPNFLMPLPLRSNKSLKA